MQNVRGQIMPRNLEPQILPAQTPTRLPPNILAGIGNIPGLNLDFSKLPNVTLPQIDLPEGIDPGGRFFTGPNGERMYSPPMPKRGPGIVGNMMMPPAINLDTGQPMDTSLRLPGLDQTPQMPTAPVQTAAPAPAPVQTAAPAPAPYTGAGYDAFGEQPFVSSVNRVESGLDPLTKQLLFGLDGKGGFIPGAMRAAEKVFYDDEGNPVVIEEKVAGLSPDQLRAQELAREGVGIQDSYLQGAQDAYGRGVSALETGLGRARGLAEQGLGATRTGLGSLEKIDLVFL